MILSGYTYQLKGVGGGDIGDMDGGHLIPWERLRDSPELRVWIRKRKRSDDGRTDRQRDRQMDRISTYRLDPWKGPVKNVLNMFLVLPLSSIFNQQEWLHPLSFYLFEGGSEEKHCASHPFSRYPSTSLLVVVFLKENVSVMFTTWQGERRNHLM